MAELTDLDDEEFNGVEMSGLKITEGGSGISKTKAAMTYHHVRNLSEHEAVSSSLYTKRFCTIIHQTLLHIAVIYCVITVTYVAFFQANSGCVCSNAQALDKNVQTFEPTNDPSLYPTPNPTNKDVLECGDHATMKYEDEILVFTVANVQEGITLNLDVSKSDILVNEIKAYYDANGITVSDALFDSDAQKIGMYAPLAATYRFKLSAKQRGNIFIEVDCEKIETFLPTLQPTRQPTYERVRMDEYNEFKTSMEASVDTLTKNVESMNTTLWTSSSMVTGWPDAIACTGSSWGHGVFYLVHGPNNALLYTYRLPDGSKIYDFAYFTDGSFSYKSALGTSNCDGKSMSQLYSEGLTFNFVSTSKQ